MHPLPRNAMLNTASWLLALVFAGAGGVADPIHLVAWAPGYPGSTEQAQPTMDAFARLLAVAAGWDADHVTAEYQGTEDGGLTRLTHEGTQLALLPLALFLKYEEQLALRPIAQVVGPEGEATETWSLVAPAGRIDSPEDLAGWTVLGIPAYSEAFVRGSILGRWGALPVDVNVEFTRRVLGGVRRAGNGENVAVLLDSVQTAALALLPNADALEIVATSDRVLMGLVVSVGARLDGQTEEALLGGLMQVHEDAAFAEVLSTVRVMRFDPVDQAALATSREAFDKAR